MAALLAPYVEQPHGVARALPWDQTRPGAHVDIYEMSSNLIDAKAGQPGCRQLSGFTALTIRHFAGDRSASAAVQAQGLIWPGVPGALTGQDPWLAWRSPQETLALGFQSAALHALLQALAPGRSETAVAVDASQALAVFDLHGPLLDAWLSHLVDAAAIPRQPGRVCRCRLADVPVLLLRLDPERLCLIADRPIAPYLGNWLAYSHTGAFDAER